MKQFTRDLSGVAAYLNKILVCRATADNHLSNLQKLLQQLQDRGLRCNREKCIFAECSVEYLGHRISYDNIAKGSIIKALKKMPAPTDVSSLKSFLGSVQLYNKFLPHFSTVITPLQELLRKRAKWH